MISPTLPPWAKKITIKGSLPIFTTFPSIVSKIIPCLTLQTQQHLPKLHAYLRKRSEILSCSGFLICQTHLSHLPPAIQPALLAWTQLLWQHSHVSSTAPTSASWFLHSVVSTVISWRGHQRGEMRTFHALKPSDPSILSNCTSALQYWFACWWDLHRNRCTAESTASESS